MFYGKMPDRKKKFSSGSARYNQGNPESSDYAIQLREKQKIRKTYGLLEKQFQNYFVKASRKKGVTGDNLVKILESRFDNTLYQNWSCSFEKSSKTDNTSQTSDCKW